MVGYPLPDIGPGDLPHPLPPCPWTSDLGTYYPPQVVLTFSDVYRNTNGWQEGGTHPTGMLPCLDRQITVRS